MNRDDLPAVVQAAIAHAQFETIHPFAEGNGRVGRCLIHVIPRKRGLGRRYVPSISVVLAGNAQAYITGLTIYRAGDIGEGCATFAAAAAKAAQRALILNETLHVLQAEWWEQAGRPRKLFPLINAFEWDIATSDDPDEERRMSPGRGRRGQGLSRREEWAETRGQ